MLKILAGAETPDDGTIELAGEVVRLASPADAHRHGIGIVYQDFSLLPNLTVAQNISLGREVTKRRRIDTGADEDMARRALGLLEVDDIPLTALVRELTQAQRQLVEIAKVLTLEGSRVLVFDEPTAALSADDAAGLFAAIRALSARGIGDRLRQPSLPGGPRALRRAHRAPQRPRRPPWQHRRDDRRSHGRADARATLESAFGRAAPPQRGSVGLVVDALAHAGLAAALRSRVAAGQIVALYGSIGSGTRRVGPRRLAGTRGARRASIRIGGRVASRPARLGPARRSIGIVPENRMDNALVRRAEGAQQRQCRLGVEGRDSAASCRSCPPAANANRSPVLRATCKSPRRRSGARSVSSVAATNRRSCWPAG